MPAYTPRGYPYPVASDRVLPQSRDFKNLAAAIDADVSSLSSEDAPVTLQGTEDVTRLDPAVYLVTNIVNARRLGMPREYPGVLTVTQATAGGAWLQEFRTLDKPPRVFVRSALNDGVPSEWREIGAPGGSGDSSGPVRRGLLREALRARKGGVIGTGGRGVIALRFDDAPEPFVQKVLPLLRERGLPFTRVSTSESVVSTGEVITDQILAGMQAYSLDSGGEVWNHGSTHGNSSGEAGIRQDFIGALDRLRAHMPRIPVDCFSPPGGSVSYDGYMPSNTVANHADTYAGQLLTAHHAIVSGYFQDSYYRPLDGVIRDGQNHYGIDQYTPDRIKNLVNSARDWGVGVSIMCHPHNLDKGDGFLTTQGLAEALDYIVGERDAGRILVLTVSGMAVADAGSDRRDDLLSVHEGVLAESISYPQFRQSIPGSTRVLTAIVEGPPGQQVTSTVAGFSKTHTVPSSGLLRLSHPVTIPLDVTSLQVTTDRPVSDAHLFAV